MVEELDKIVYFLHFKVLPLDQTEPKREVTAVKTKRGTRRPAVNETAQHKQTMSFQADVAHTCTHNYLNLIPSNPACGTPRVLTCGKITKLTKTDGMCFLFVCSSPSPSPFFQPPPSLSYPSHYLLLTFVFDNFCFAIPIRN